MAQRVTALVSVHFTREEVADAVGLSPGEVVNWGNGYAVVAPKAKPKRQSKPPVEEAAPEAPVEE